MSRTKVWRYWRRAVFSKRGAGSVAWKIVRAVIVFGLCFFIIYPFFAKIMDTFKTEQDLYNVSVQYVPLHFTTVYLQKLLSDMHYWTTAAKTAGFCAIVALLQTASSALVAYGLARFKFRGNKLVFALIIFTLLIPPQTIMLPLYTRFRFFLGFMNLLNTPYPTLILSATGLYLKNGLFIFMLRQFFRNLPNELEEAAYIDGNNALQTFMKIIIPTSVTMLATVFLLSFCWQWTDIVFSRIFMPKMELMVNMVGNSESEILLVNSMLKNSSAVLAVLPLLVVYFFGQNLFVQSVERSGITG